MAGGMEEVDLSTLKVNSRCHIKPQISKMHAFVISFLPEFSITSVFTACTVYANLIAKDRGNSF